MLVCVYLCISEMKDNNDENERREELGLFCIIRYSYYLRCGTVLFKSECGLIVNVYHILQEQGKYNLLYITAFHHCTVTPS